MNPQSAEGSIYGNVKDNIAFRAWHDKLHQDLDAGFDHEGELRVAQEHLRQAQAAGLSEEAQRALWADTWESFKHHEQTGNFPEEPRKFVAEKMKDQFPGDQTAKLNIGHSVVDTGVMNKKSVSTALAKVGARSPTSQSSPTSSPRTFRGTSV